MSPKKISDGAEKKKVKRITIEIKKEIVEKYERGVRTRDLCRQYGMVSSTISTIIKNKEKIKAANLSKGMTIIATKKRTQAIEDMENLLLIWIKERQIAGDSINEPIIAEKARRIHADLIKNAPGTSDEHKDFKASRGWFERFKKRTGIHNVTRHGEASSANEKEADAFVKEFNAFVKKEGYVPQQIFNVDETGLFWKKLPNRTYITKEEKSLPGHKPMKDRLTLVLCGNASGDCRIKPMLIYHSENPRAFKQNKVVKENLPVMWRSNAKAWGTRALFMEWLRLVCAKEIEKYLKDNNLPRRCVLLLDNASCHPKVLEEIIQDEFDFITVKFLPPNTTSLIQPMDQQVIANFKKLYTKFMFQKCFEVISDTNLTLKDFWKHHFNIFSCICLIDKAWKQLSYRVFNSSWRKMLPDAVPERDFDGFEREVEELVDDIVKIGNELGLQVNEDDVVELLDSHDEKLSTDDLKQLKEEQEMLQTIDVEEDFVEEKLSTAEIKKMCGMWNELQTFIQRHHPNKISSVNATDILNDSMCYFRNVLKTRQKQTKIDAFFSKRGRDEEQEAEPSSSIDEQKAGPSETREEKEAKRQRREREKTPTECVPSVLLEDDSPLKK